MGDPPHKERVPQEEEWEDPKLRHGHPKPLHKTNYGVILKLWKRPKGERISRPLRLELSKDNLKAPSLLHPKGPQRSQWETKGPKVMTIPLWPKKR